MTLDDLILEHYSDVAIDKRLTAQVGLGERALPAFVIDWLVARFSGLGGLDKEALQEFVSNHLPDKSQSNVLRNKLVNGETLAILDSFSARVDIKTGAKLVSVPSLDINDARVEEYILERHPLLLVGHLWGAAKLRRRLDPNDESKGHVWIEDFKPMQVSGVDLQFYIMGRRHFAFSEWRELLVRSLGYNPVAYTEEQQHWLLTRLVPMVQSRCNLIELAPKGTGKSTVYADLSRHSWLISGGTVTRAQLFYDMARRTAGIITRYDVVVLDEAQSVQFDNPNQMVGALKGYLEKGEFSISQFKATSEAGFVLLANIPIGGNGEPLEDDYFKYLPPFLGETALIDRFHGILPGWKIPRISKESISATVGLKADYLAEVFHLLRMETRYVDWVREHVESTGDLRDIRAVERIASGLLKLFFPDLECITPELFVEYCLNPAKQMRQFVRRQLSQRDAEYRPQLAKIELKR